MPNEKDIIYCILLDDSGRMVNTSMLTISHAKHILESAAKLLSDRKEN